MKCVPIRPFEVAPQMKKVVASSQKAGVPNARRTTPPSRLADAGGSGGPAGAPYGRSPTSAGALRTSVA